MNIKHDKVIPLPVPGTGPSQELAWKYSEEPEYLAAGAKKGRFLWGTENSQPLSSKCVHTIR